MYNILICDDQTDIVNALKIYLAPEGYNLLTEPVELVISGTTHLEANAVTVTNSARFQLPETGGIGTALFTLGGAGILGAAALVLLGGKKKNH